MKNLDEINLFSEAFITHIKSAQEAKIVQSVDVGQTEKQNELVFFVKPELLIVDDQSKVLNSLRLIEEKFVEHNVTVCGAAIVPGAILESFKIMNRHYGFINQLSRKASTMIDQNTREKIFELLDTKDSGKHKILGGHEFLSTFNSNLDMLGELWFGQGAQKLRSGFYFIECTFQEVPIILVNGFHPSQLVHFTKEEHRILLMLLHTNTDWYDLKFDLVGDTFPENAKTDSIRGMLYGNPQYYGLEKVGVNTNGVHLSAGPFEAAFEVVNFFGALLNLDPAKSPPLAIRKAINACMSEDQALRLLENPIINDKDLFTQTENQNTDTAINLAKKRLDGN